MKAVFAVISAFVFVSVGCWFFDNAPADLILLLACSGILVGAIAVFTWLFKGGK